MKVAVLFGGKSCEHDVSILTGLETIKTLRSHDARAVYISRDGEWYFGEKLHDVSFYKVLKQNSGALKKLRRVYMSPPNSYLKSKTGKTVFRPDVFLLCGHGVNFEDGSIQGLMQLCSVAYTGCDCKASGVGMDKELSKRIFYSEGLNQTRYIALKESDYQEDYSAIISRIKAELKFPLMVKPANLGSSIGIAKAYDFASLDKSLRVAFCYDQKVIIENALEDFIELNCAVISINGVTIASEVERPIGWKEFLTFEDKYNVKTLGEGREFPAKISDALRNKVRSYAIKAYDAIGGSGVARVDFMYCNDELFINEINTIPGALATYLFDYDYGIKPYKLLDLMLNEALVRKNNTDCLKYSYSSPIGLKIKK